jgi:membrane fusion protein (multidrug efflux system)
MKIKHIVYALLLMGIGGFIVYRIIENQDVSASNGKGSSNRTAVMQVNGQVIQPRSFANVLSVSGTLEANEEVDIHPEVSGIVEGIYFEEGSTVVKGQALLKVDDTELRAHLSQASTQEGLASENERRAGLLLAKEAISQEEYDIAVADFKSASAQRELIQAQLSKTALKAPFSGTIGLRSISPGSYVSPTTVVARLVSMQPLKLTFSIPEKYSGQVSINTELAFKVAGSEKRYEAVVYALEPSIETATRTLRLRARADNKDQSLRPGSFATIELPLTTLDSALLIPTEAVIPVQDGKKVFIVENGKAKEVMVETSTRTAKDILVTSGLHPGDTVLTSGVMTLKNGTAVNVSITEIQPGKE